MSKTLILKARFLDAQGRPQWHDKFVLGNAISNICKGKDIMKLAPWISVAGKIELAAEAIKLGSMVGEEGDIHQNLPELQVEMRNQEASLLWEELKKLTFESFGTPLVCRKCGGTVENVPNPGTLVLMLADIAEAFGEKMPEGEEDKD